MTNPVSPREALTIIRIVRVNHAGEHAAIHIYTAQIAVAARRYPDIVPDLSEMLRHEKEHRAAFAGAMPARSTRPCRAMWLWGWGGWLLGFITALLGRQAIGICTAAVESTVHHHLDDQLLFLAERDRGLRDIILAIREEELAHLHHAETRIASVGLWERLLDRAISIATDALIWVSTWGDSARMARDLRVAQSEAK